MGFDYHERCEGLTTTKSTKDTKRSISCDGEKMDETGPGLCE